VAVIKIDDELYKKILKLIKGKNRFDFPSAKTFVDKAVIKTIKEYEDEKSK